MNLFHSTKKRHIAAIYIIVIFSSILIWWGIHGIKEVDKEYPTVVD